MKKIPFIILLCISFLPILLFINIQTNYIENSLFKKATKVCFIVDENEITENFLKNENFNYVKVGNKFFLYEDNNFNKLKNIKYDYIEFVLNDVSVQQLIKKFNIKITYTETINNEVVYYGYCCNLMKEVYLNNLKINVQIVEVNNTLKVGYPMIYSAF